MSQPDVERDEGEADASLAQCLKDLGRVMQSCSGRRQRTGLGGIDGLVPVEILSARALLIPPDIRRQWHFAQGFQLIHDVMDALEADPDMPFLAFFDDLGGDARCLSRSIEQFKSIPGLESFGWSEQGPPVVGLIFPAEQEFNLSPGFRFEGVQAGGDDFGIVQDQEISGPEQGGQFGEVAMRVRTGGAVDGEQPRRFPPGHRLLGDAFLRQRIVEA